MTNPCARIDATESLRRNDLRKAIRRGDKFVEKVIEQTAEYLGIGVANLVNILGPEVLGVTMPFKPEGLTQSPPRTQRNWKYSRGKTSHQTVSKASVDEWELPRFHFAVLAAFA